MWKNIPLMVIVVITKRKKKGGKDHFGNIKRSWGFLTLNSKFKKLSPQTSISLIEMVKVVFTCLSKWSGKVVFCWMNRPNIETSGIQMTHHPSFSMLEDFIANVFSASRSCVVIYLLCYFFQVQCVFQPYFDLFIRDFAGRLRCAFMDHMRRRWVVLLAQKDFQLLLPRVLENGVRLVLRSRNIKE